MDAWTRLGRRLCNVGICAVGSAAAISFNATPILAANDKSNSNSLRIAIIGSGVGGASTAYFLRDLLNQQSDRQVIIDMYEKNDYVGGRVRGANLEEYCGGNYMKDVGATIIIKQNKYMMDFAQNILNLDLFNESESNDDGGDDLGFAFFDEPRGKLSTVWDEKWGTFKLIKQWGFIHFITLMYNARSFVKNFGQIYDLQKDQVSFDNAIDLWNSLNLGDTLYGNGMEYVNDQINKFMPSFLEKETRNWAPSTLQLVTALTRNNYTQEPEDLPPIVTAGAVSTLAANGLCYVKNGGNNLVEQGLIKLAKVNLNLNLGIKTITKTTDNKYILNNNSIKYDYVILAAPISHTKIEFGINKDKNDDCNKQIELLSKQEYVGVYRHFVKGKLNPCYFGFDDEDEGEMCIKRCGTIFSSNLGALPKKNEYRVTHKSLPCTTIARDNETEWIRFMGPNKMTDDVLNQILKPGWNRESSQYYHWKAYPKFKWNRENIDCLSVNTQKRMLSFCIDNDGLYNLNVLECGMSAQEVSAVAAKNVALLVAKRIMSQSDKHSIN